MVYNVILTEFAQSQLDNIVSYVAFDLCNKSAASEILSDVEEAVGQLSFSADVYALCTESELKEHNYIRFHLRRHRYILLYRIVKSDVYIDRIYHELQDYQHLL